jgi:nicotinate-nucleotide adenylyltransferase
VIGIFGGSFDPPHYGHLQIIQNFREKFNSRLFVIPNFISPFKEKKATDPEHILGMLSLLKQEFTLEGVDILDLELKRGGVSYTYRTILEIKEMVGLEEISLLIGEDNLQSLSKWKNIEWILETVSVLVYLRPGQKRVMIPSELENYNTRIQIQENSLNNASSTEFRQTKNPEMVTPKVLEYIQKYNLYENRTN